MSYNLATSCFDPDNSLLAVFFIINPVITRGNNLKGLFFLLNHYNVWSSFFLLFGHTVLLQHHFQEVSLIGGHTIYPFFYRYFNCYLSVRVAHMSTICADVFYQQFHE